MTHPIQIAVLGALYGQSSRLSNLVLGHRALAAGDDTLRRESLREGEHALSQANVAPNAASVPADMMGKPTAYFCRAFS